MIAPATVLDKAMNNPRRRPQRAWSAFESWFADANHQPPDDGELVRLMRHAHAAERAAAWAYRGHAAIVGPRNRKRDLFHIAREEWAHRAVLATMLRSIGRAPQWHLECIYGVIGATIGLLCFIVRDNLATWFAGRLERNNAGEYHRLAFLLARHGYHGWIAVTQHMAKIEAEHERLLASWVIGWRGNALLQRYFAWNPLHCQRRPQQGPLPLFRARAA